MGELAIGRECIRIASSMIVILQEERRIRLSIRGGLQKRVPARFDIVGSFVGSNEDVLAVLKSPG